MAFVRTPKGTASRSTQGTTLSLGGVQLDQATSCIVGVGFRANQERTGTVTWGGRTLRRRAHIYGGNIGCELHILPRVRRSGSSTRPISVTWDGNVRAGALFVTQFDQPIKVDERITDSTGNTGTPSAGPTPSIHYLPEIAIAAFAGAGQLSGAIGTPGDGFTLGQRDGTDTGSQDLVLTETYKEIDTLGPVTASLSGADVQRWSTSLAVLHGVIKDRAMMYLWAEWFNILVTNQATDGVNAWVLLCHARYNNDFLPNVPSPDTLTELGMTLGEYQSARTRLETEGIVTLLSDGTIG